MHSCHRLVGVAEHLLLPRPDVLHVRDPTVGSENAEAAVLHLLAEVDLQVFGERFEILHTGDGWEIRLLA